MLTKIKDIIQGKVPIDKSRSPEWSKVRKEHLEKNPCCAVCGGTKMLEVHHINPFHIHPELELDPNNLITLCEGVKSCNHHLHYGHLGNYKKVNPKVVEDAAQWFNRLKEYSTL